MRTVSRVRSHTVIARSALVVALLASLVACSGDAEPSESSATGSSGSSASESSGEGGGSDPSSEDGDATDLPQLRTCTVVVDGSGDAEASWKGKGDARVRTDTESGPTARYTASKGNALVIVYSPDDAVDYPAITFSKAQESFTSVEADASDIAVERDGSGAEAQLTLTGFDGASVDIDVSFTCKAKGSAKNEG